MLHFLTDEMKGFSFNRYGFRGPPRLKLVAKPQVGERAVTITHITDWIERKLEIEFQVCAEVFLYFLCVESNLVQFGWCVMLLVND